MRRAAKHGNLRWIISIGISGALVYYLLGRIELRDLVDTLRNVHLPSLALFVAVPPGGPPAPVRLSWLLPAPRPGPAALALAPRRGGVSWTRWSMAG